MNFNIPLSKNFATQFNKMVEKYGEEMTYLNGFGDKQLGLTTFIDNFIDTETVADASIDGNANVGHKDIVSLQSEMSKPQSKLLAFNKIYYELNKKYGFKVANDWLENEWNGHFYLHDAASSSFLPYCYKGQENVIVKYKNKIFSTSIKKLIDFCQDDEIYFDKTINQNAYHPNELYIKDVDNEWTKIIRIVSHENNKPMRFIKVANGNSFIVTEDHPCITLEGDIPAKDLTTEDSMFTVMNNEFDNTINYIDVQLTKGQAYNNFTKGKGRVYLTKELGWLTGILLSEGTANPSSVKFKQDREKSTLNYQKIIYILNKYDLPYRYDENEDAFSLKMCPYTNWILSFMKGTLSFNKALPHNYIHYNYEFLDGILAGMIDGDGTIDGYKNRHCQIRITSEELVHQLGSYLNSKNIFTGDRVPFKYNREGSFDPNYPMFGLGFSLGENEEYFLSIESTKINNKYVSKKREGNFKNKRYNYSYGWSKIIENSEYIDDCPVVYDITTESGHFIANNILAHNCYAYDIKDLVNKGLYFIEDFNGQAPKHLTTFTDFVGEFVSWTSNRSSGACGLPSFLIYSFYFWKKDCEEGYAIKSPEYYAKQEFQRIVYKLNQPYLRVNQSAFSNFSIFDRPYLEALFEGDIYPSELTTKDGFKSAMVLDFFEEIIEYEKLFMTVVSEIRSKNMMTFPVISISLLRKDGKFIDEDFAKWACKHNMQWADSNFFISDSVTSLSNCCRLVSDIDNLGYE